MNRLAFGMLILSLLTSAAIAGEFNRVLSIGETAPAWNDLPGTDGKKHSLGELKQAKVVVVVFTCNSCPYATDAEQRLIALTKDYLDHGVEVVAINVNKVEEDQMPAMKHRASHAKFNFTYMIDDTQQIAKAFGAMYTPEFFVLDQQRCVIYMGALDDSPDAKNVKQQYVRNAIDAALTDSKPSVQETVPIGCRIRFERSRRSRKQP